jgi:hypothetical protein
MKRSDFTSGKSRVKPFDPKVTRVDEGTENEHVAVLNGQSAIRLYADGRILIDGVITVNGGIVVRNPEQGITPYNTVVIGNNIDGNTGTIIPPEERMNGGVENIGAPPMPFPRASIDNDWLEGT